MERARMAGRLHSVSDGQASGTCTLTYTQLHTDSALCVCVFVCRVHRFVGVADPQLWTKLAR